MSIDASFNYATGQWVVAVAPESQNFIVRFGLASDHSAVTGLRFRIVTETKNKVAFAQEFPPPGVTFLETDETYFWTTSGNVKSGESAAVEFVVLVDNNIISSRRVEFDAPIPPSLFSSWVWNADFQTWQPPVPCPNDDGVYRWDEPSANWVLWDGVDESGYEVI